MTMGYMLRSALRTIWLAYICNFPCSLWLEMLTSASTTRCQRSLKSVCSALVDHTEPNVTWRFGLCNVPLGSFGPVSKFDETKGFLGNPCLSC